MNRQELESLFRDLYKISIEDGIITIEEKKLLDKVNEKIDLFLSAYDKAMEDNILSKEEVLLLNQLYENILNHTEEEAVSDHEITNDEFKILMRIVKTIHKQY